MFSNGFKEKNRKHNRHYKQYCGFTLIEMLIALAIGATVSVMAYQSLASAIRADEKVSRIAAQIDEVDRVWQNMSADLLFAVERMWFNRSGEQKSSMIGVFGDRLSQSDALIASESDYLLQFIRGNNSNFLNQERSDLFLVGYRLTQEEDEETKTLWRDTWGPVDGSGDPKVQKRRLLRGIKEMSFRYLPTTFRDLDASAWSTGWPVSENATKRLPAAVEVTIDSQSLGTIKRLFPLSVNDS